VTLGQLRFRLTKAFPGVDADLIDGWIQDVYAEILAELPWSRQQVTATLQTTAPYETGTVAVTEGSNAVTLTGGAWTTGMTGRAFRVTGREEYYEFTQTGASTGTLDRVYEGDTAAAASYKIFQFIYPLPLDCRTLQDDAFPSLVRLSGPQLDATSYGDPTNWASYMEDGSTPPRMQVELSPVPVEAVAIPFNYTADADTLSATSAILKVWIQPAALIEGVTGRIKAHLGDYVGAAFHVSAHRTALDKMRGVEVDGMAATEIQLPSHYTAHRRRRW
jgi:hypothetical protein